MDAMEEGEEGFFYHSGDDREIVGIVRIARRAHQDSTTDDKRWRCVDIAAVEPLARPVTLDEIKRTTALAQMVLVKNSRLSVQPVSAEEWRLIRTLGGL
jgi:predicted RNA-binding protein with PUA-like domain